VKLTINERSAFTLGELGLTITAQDPEGSTHEISVANETADQLAAILLSARPPEVGEQMRRPAIPVREAVVGLDKQSGAHVLELQLSGDIAIHFLLSKPLVRQLAKKLVDPRWKIRATTK